MNTNENSPARPKKGGRPPKVAQDAIDDILVYEKTAEERSQIMAQVKPAIFQVCPVHSDASIAIKPGVLASAGRLYRRLLALGVTPADVGPKTTAEDVTTSPPKTDTNGQSQSGQVDTISTDAIPSDQPAVAPTPRDGPENIGQETVGHAEKSTGQVSKPFGILICIISLFIASGLVAVARLRSPNDTKRDTGHVEKAFRVAQLGEVDHSIGTSLPSWALIADVKNGAEVLKVLPELPLDLAQKKVGCMVDAKLRRALVIDVETSEAAETMKNWGARHDLLVASLPGWPAVVVILDRK